MQLRQQPATIMLQCNNSPYLLNVNMPKGFLQLIQCSDCASPPSPEYCYRHRYNENILVIGEVIFNQTVIRDESVAYLHSIDIHPERTTPGTAITRQDACQIMIHELITQLQQQKHFKKLVAKKATCECYHLTEFGFLPHPSHSGMCMLELTPKKTKERRQK